MIWDALSSLLPIWIKEISLGRGAPSSLLFVIRFLYARVCALIDGGILPRPCKYTHGENEGRILCRDVGYE